MNQFENIKSQEDKVVVVISEFKKLPIWLCWRYEKKNNNDRPTKVPYEADGIAIVTTKEYRGRWVSFEEANKAYEKLSFNGVGFVIPKDFGDSATRHRHYGTHSTGESQGDRPGGNGYYLFVVV